ncbi:MAG: glycosyltransferase family 4 protein [Methanocellales archaeon]|nr:glycosyltransferase family 4 protein [Methanocellales archaeon]
MLAPFPKIFRWHIPLNVESFSDDLRKFVLRHMQNHDALIVSCKKYLDSLQKAGYKGRAYQVYPYTDQSAFTTPSESEVHKFCDEFGIGDENVISVVARIVPMKAQDVAIKALPAILKRFPKTKLLLIGDGSFTSAKRGGLGYHKGAIWQSKLEELVKGLGIEENVIFTGYLPDKELRAAYARSDVVVLPSIQEGFGLVVIEAWLYKKPAVISSGAGVSELIVEGENGYVFDPKNPEELAEKAIGVLSHPEKGVAIGEMGFDTVTKEYAEGTKPIWDIFSEVLG